MSDDKQLKQVYMNSLNPTLIRSDGELQKILQYPFHTGRRQYMKIHRQTDRQSEQLSSWQNTELAANKKQLAAGEGCFREETPGFLVVPDFHQEYKNL